MAFFVLGTGGMTCIWSRLSLAVLAVTGLGCGASQPAPAKEPVVVWVGEGEALDQAVSEAVVATTPVGAGEECWFFWGDVAEGSPHATPASFVWNGGSRSLDGVLLCGTLAEAAVGGPRTDRLILHWRSGELVANDPQGLSSKLEDRPLAEASVPSKRRTVAIFESDTSDTEAHADVVLAQLDAITDQFAFGAWPLR